jgi:hypothetical protein
MCSLRACCHVLPVPNLLNTYDVFICLIGDYCIFFKKNVVLMLYGQYFSYLLSVYLTIYHPLFFKNMCWTDVIWPVLQLS